MKSVIVRVAIEHAKADGFAEMRWADLRFLRQVGDGAELLERPVPATLGEAERSTAASIRRRSAPTRRRIASMALGESQALGAPAREAPVPGVLDLHLIKRSGSPCVAARHLAASLA